MDVFLKEICPSTREVRHRYGTGKDPPTIKLAIETSFLKQYEGARERGGKPKNDFLERECLPSLIGEELYL